MKFATVTVTIFAGGLILCGCGGSDKPEVANSQSGLSRQTPASIDPGATTPYDRQTFPDLYAEWGKAGIARINKLRVAAAATVARNPECGQVTDVELLDKANGSTHSKPLVFVDCDKPLRRFIVSENDVKGQVSSQRQAGQALAEIVEKLCLDAVTAKLQFPSSISVDRGSIAKDQSTATGNWGVNFDFTARNGMGIAIPQTARCTVSATGQTEASIYNR